METRVVAYTCRYSSEPLIPTATEWLDLQKGSSTHIQFYGFKEPYLVYSHVRCKSKSFTTIVLYYSIQCEFKVHSIYTSEVMDHQSL